MALTSYPVYAQFCAGATAIARLESVFRALDIDIYIYICIICPRDAGSSFPVTPCLTLRYLLF